MSQKNHEHRGTEGAAHSHKHEHGHEHQQHKSRGLHRDWRVWVAVVLMLVAMGVYVLSFDESLWPFGGGEQPAVPAAAP